MLKLPKILPKKPLQMVDDPNMKQLFEKLKEIESTPNVITLDVFREFEPLFKKNNNLSKKQVDDLTQKYIKLVDFYKETQIIVSNINRAVILTLPAIFTPVRSLETNEKNSALVATNAAMSHHNVPKYSSDAFANMFSALRNEQVKNVDVIREYKERYISCARDFFEKYSSVQTPKETPIAEENILSTSDSATEWLD